MGKRRGITINIRDHDAEQWDAELNDLRQQIAQLKETQMATMQDVEGRIRAMMQDAERDRTVVGGLRTVMDAVVAEVRALRPLVGDPNALVEALDALEGTLDANRDAVAAAVATGTAAEAEPAMPTDAPPNPDPLRAAGIRNPQGSMGTSDSVQAGAGAEADLIRGVQEGRAAEFGIVPQGGENAAQNAPQGGQPAAAPQGAPQGANAAQAQQTAGGQHPNFTADPVQATMPADQDATKVRAPQPARAAQAQGDVANAATEANANAGTAPQNGQPQGG